MVLETDYKLEPESLMGKPYDEGLLGQNVSKILQKLYLKP